MPKIKNLTFDQTRKEKFRLKPEVEVFDIFILILFKIGLKKVKFRTYEADFTGNPVHFLTVSSSFPIPNESSHADGKFTWTGFENLSWKENHELVWFFEKEFCDENDFSDFESWIPEVQCDLLSK